MRKLKIALLAPLTRSPHPDTRGSRPKIVYDIARYLVDKGHDVTTYAAGDTEIAGNLVKVIPESIYAAQAAENPFYQHTLALSKLIYKIQNDSDQFDIIHNHVYPEFLPLLIASSIKTPMLTTIHLPIDEAYADFLTHYSELFFTTVSDNQRKNIKYVKNITTVYNGIDPKEFPLKDEKGKYLLFFGRIKEGDPKGVVTAIKVAQLTGENLKIAGNVESVSFYEREIKPHLNDKIQFVGPVDPVGPISFTEKIELYQNALALLFPINWPEPFGMTMIEAMSCGTPVIAFDNGAVDEVIKDGEVGYICEAKNINQMVKAVKEINLISRFECHKYVEDNFSLQKMVNAFEKIYFDIVNN